MNDKLKKVVAETKKKIVKYKMQNIGEANTKSTLISPLLVVLGWDVCDLEHVKMEYKGNAQDNPVDYALMILGKPRLFIEAKGIGEDLSHRKWIGQILGYATVAGVRWCLLTDGDEYRIYNAAAPVDASKKLLGKIKISEDDEDDIVKFLNTISRVSLENKNNCLDEWWKVDRNDRSVKGIVEDLLNGADSRIVRMISKQTGLDKKDVTESLIRLNFNIDLSEGLVTQPIKDTSKQQPVVKQKHTVYSVKVDELISSGVISTPAKLYGTYKKTMLHAVLLDDGYIEFQGHKYAISKSSCVASGTVNNGTEASINGWDFWKISDGNGGSNSLSEIRDKYMKQKGLTT